MKALLVILTVASIAISRVGAQTPAPAPAAAATDSLPVAVKQLQEIKVANDELLKKQEAALQRLEELQKAADELKIFGKRS